MAALVPPQPPSPAAEAEAEAIKPEKTYYMNLPCPVPYDDIHREAMMSIKDEHFEGMRVDFTKELNQRFSLTHSIFMGPIEIPSQCAEIIKIPTAHYGFGANFVDPNLMLTGKVMTDGQLTSEPHMSHGRVSFDYKGTDCRTRFLFGNGTLLGASYMQSVTPHLSLGGKIVWIGLHRESDIGCAARYNTDKMVAAGEITGTGLVSLSYVQKVSEKVSLVTGLRVFRTSRDIIASVGYDYVLRQSRLWGMIDSNGCVGAFLEKRLNMDLNLILSAER